MITPDNPYRAQVQLWVEVLPYVATETCLALKGGTAINLFIRDMPRLSVDIDLAYVPLNDRTTALQEINAAMEGIKTELQASSNDYDVRVTKRVEKAACGMIVKNYAAEIKIEVTPVLRGDVYPSTLRRIVASAEEAFGFAEVPSLSFEDVYADTLLINDLSITGTHGKKATPLCPCGYLGHHNGKCRCTPDQVARYRSRISGPLLDRIGLQIEVPALPQEDMTRQAQGDASAVVRKRAATARDVALARQGKPNALLTTREIDSHCVPDEKGETLLKQAIVRLGLSARAYHRILKVARTIADLAGAATVSVAHVAEAIQYRRFERG